jgi:hypothetical protein
VTSHSGPDDGEASDDGPKQSSDLEDPFVQAAQAFAERLADCETVQAGDEYREQCTYMERLTTDFVLGVRSAALAFTRYPAGREWLLQASIDDLLESAISLVTLAGEGVFNVGRRELRYVLELVVKCVYCDQVLPADAPLRERIALAGDPAQVPRSSVDVVDRLTLRMIPDPLEFVHRFHGAFGALSGYTHVSKPQLEERLRRVERGEFIGFEGPATLRAFNALVAQTYDLVLALVFEGIGPAFTGDLFIQILDDEPSWKFHKGRYVGQISRYFDYKAERQNRNR